MTVIRRARQAASGGGVAGLDLQECDEEHGGKTKVHFAHGDEGTSHKCESGRGSRARRGRGVARRGRVSRRGTETRETERRCEVESSLSVSDRPTPDPGPPRFRLGPADRPTAARSAAKQVLRSDRPTDRPSRAERRGRSVGPWPRVGTPPRPRRHPEVHTSHLLVCSVCEGSEIREPGGAWARSAGYGGVSQRT